LKRNAEKDCSPEWFKEKSLKDRSVEYEEQAAEKFGGKRVKGSGNQPNSRGDIDIKDQELMIEHKFTDKQSFSISKKLLRKVEKDAELRCWAININISGDDLIVISSDLFKEMLDDFRTTTR